jgi:hypothetical protein
MMNSQKFQKIILNYNFFAVDKFLYALLYSITPYEMFHDPMDRKPILNWHSITWRYPQVAETYIYIIYWRVIFLLRFDRRNLYLL